mmetsp:Transcript_29877/g.75201  ORF Transcript_29877/g.75201 Transcript_29877/m.75201 type:complete len:240 (-) Transcript_29877:766-1485(-)
MSTMSSPSWIALNVLGRTSSRCRPQPKLHGCFKHHGCSRLHVRSRHLVLWTASTACQVRCGAVLCTRRLSLKSHGASRIRRWQAVDSAMWNLMIPSLLLNAIQVKARQVVMGAQLPSMLTKTCRKERELICRKARSKIRMVRRGTMRNRKVRTRSVSSSGLRRMRKTRQRKISLDRKEQKMVPPLQDQGIAQCMRRRSWLALLKPSGPQKRSWTSSERMAIPWMARILGGPAQQVLSQS